MHRQFVALDDIDCKGVTKINSLVRGSTDNVNVEPAS